MKKEAPISVKITIVGDGMVGKTCLLYVYTKKEFPVVYIPTVFDNYVADVTLDGVLYEMKLWDTAGQEDYDRLRPLSYPHTTCFIVCYSVDSKSSYNNVATKWVPEVRHHMPHTPIILVATKSDLRRQSDPNKPLIKPEDGQDLKRIIKAIDYMECSALENLGLDDIFNAAIRNTQKAPARKTMRFCKIL